MDPNLFHLDWERTFEVVGAIIVLSFFVERALAPLFENKHFHQRFGDKGIKELLAFAVALGVCVYAQFDAVSIVVLREKVGVPGQVVTAGIIAGGSKASIRLFHDLLNVRNDLSKVKPAGAEGDGGGG